MNRANLIIFGASSCLIIFLSVYVSVWSYQDVLSFNTDRHENYISKREAVADTAAEQHLLKIMRMRTELHKKQANLNAGLLRVFRKLAFALICIAFTQLAVLYAIRKESKKESSKNITLIRPPVVKGKKIL